MLLGNLHIVVPGRVYRSAQLSDAELDGLIEKRGIRTVINLRGCCNPFPWYLEECRATHCRGVNQEDIGFSAGRLPSVPEIHRLVEVLDRTDYPILLHCNRGADRTGLASAIVVMLMTDATLAEGRRQLSLRYSHLALGRPASLDRFFDLYSEWLDARETAHSREIFRRWLLQEYCPGECRCEMEPLSFPDCVPGAEPFVLKVRCRNTSIKPWRLQKENNAGIHLLVIVTDERGRNISQGEAGCFDAVVEPGDSIELTVGMPAVYRPGHYRVVVDMAHQNPYYTFSQVGHEPLERDLEVR
jgi:protein tyrosine phosphatase (PTP) superfamily phosphohydrolase (DUF442 family)